jgi:hypothetical protein
MKQILLLATVLLLCSCHGTPGDPNYTELPEDFRGSGEPEFKDPTPYVPGTNRLSISIFYEGAYSKILILDDVQRHFYIYDSTFNIADENAIVREGLRADAFVAAGTPWWGGGVTWDNAEDLSSWTIMHVSLWSDNEAHEATEIEIEGGGVTRRVAIADYGFVANGAWHDLAIPMSDIADTGVDISAITRPFVLAGENTPMGATLVVDNLYYE